ncbi:putative dioxygenase [Gordonia amicalis NBRC 100051 = JCM 11271]|nr:putative dioxygenase [Gordonia amicalis NBRC 100051 = JCM 11271]
MESFIQHRKGRTPRQVHRDLEDLKDDELGRYGFTGRTAHLYRRNDPTQFRAVGTHTGVDRFVTELTPTDQIDPSGEPLLMFYNDDCRISLSRRSQAAPFWFRPVDGDELIFVHEGTGHFETEFGRLSYRPGDYVYIPKGCTYRQIPDDQSLLLIIEAVDEYRVPEPGVLGRFFPFDSSLVAVPEAEVFEGDGREEYEVRFRQREGRRRCSIRSIRSTSRGGAATCSRSPSTSRTTTSSPRSRCTSRRPCICSCRPRACM